MPVAIALGIVLAVAWLVPALPSRALTVRVDLSASAGASVVLFLNDYADPPQVAQLVPGVRRTYTFEPREGDITRIRVDIADRAGVDVRVYAVDVLDDDGALAAHFGPAELSTWARYFVSDPIPDPDALRLTSRAASASLDSFQSVPAASSLPWPLQPVVDTLDDRQDRLQMSLVLFGLGACMIALAFPQGRWSVGLAAAVTMAALGILEVILRDPEGVESASAALGRATYYGLSLPTNLRAIRAEFVSAALLGIGAAALWRLQARRIGRAAAERKAPAGEEARVSWAGYVAAAATALAALATFTPDLRRIVRDTLTTQHVTGWDVENLLSWTAFSARGLVPMRDYWYPYGNSDVFTSSLLTGPVIFAAYQLALLLAFWWVFWVASGRRLVASSLGTLGLLVAQPLIGEFPRYGFALGVALAFTCIDPDDKPDRARRARIVFGLLTTIALFVEPILVVYAAAGVATVLVVDVLRGRRRGFGWWLRRLAADFAVPVLGLVVWIAVTGVRGQLDGMLSLYLEIGEAAAYTAEPTPLGAGFRTALELTVLVLWVPAVLVAVAMFARLCEKGGGLGHSLASRLLVTGTVAVPLLHKHALRGVPTQLLLFVVVAALLMLVSREAWRSAPNLVGALAGMGVAAVLAFPGPRLAFDGLSELPERVSGSVDLVLTDRTEIDRANELRFSDTRFSGYSQELAVANDLRQRLDVDEADLYVLGDAPILYVLLAQQPPWQLTPYSTSPLSEQRRAIEWLEERRPRFVVIDRTTDSFDGVPHDVRIPLVFQHVIEHYAYDHAVGPFDVLRRASGKHRPQSRYWAGVLGGDADVGQLPSVSSYDDIRPCKRGEEENCGRFLRLSAPRRGWRGRVDVPVRFGRQAVVIRFQATGRLSYTIPLARTWAWGLSHRPVLSAPLTPGWRATIVAAEQPSGVLY